MIIDKKIISQIYRPYFFVSGVCDIDEEYFKKRIEEGIKNSDLSYNTNVYGQQTSWKFFNNDKNFNVLLMQMIDSIKELNGDNINSTAAWGIIEGFGDYTKKHRHNNNTFYISGAFYLNDHPQKLYFPEINQEIIPQKGRFVFFSSFLLHYTNKNTQNTKKYAISFNLGGRAFEI